MSLAFPSPEFIPPTKPPPVGWDRPWNKLHPWTRIFLCGLTLSACLLQVLPIIDRSDSKLFIDAEDFGFPVSYLTLREHSTNPFDLTAFLGDILAVGALIIASTCWMERYLRQPNAMQSWRNIHRRTWILMVALIVAGTVIEVYPIIREYGDERMNFPDNMPGTNWLGRGVPFTYHRIDSAEIYPRGSGLIIPYRTTFNSTILVFDFILLGAAIAEAGYWFEKWQRRRPVAVSCQIGSPP